MTTKPLPTVPLLGVSTRVRFLSKVLLSPRLYEIISEPLQNMSQLDSTLGTICYASLFLSVIVKKFPQLRDLIKVLKPKLVKFIRGVFTQLLKRVLFAVKTILSQVSNVTTKFDKLQRFNGAVLTTEELVSSSLNQLNKSNGTGDSSEKVMPKSVSEMTKSELHLSATLKALSRYLSDVRMFYRGFQIPGSIAGLLSAPSQLWGEGQYIDLLSTISICLYQPLETIAFLLDKSWLLPSPAGPEKCEWWYLTSTKLWFFWVLVELGHSIIDTIKELRGGMKCRGRPSIHLLLRAMGNLDHKKWVVLLEHLATIPLCIHWSLPEGCLNDLQVGLFGTLAGGLSTTLIWSNVWNKLTEEFK